MFEKWVQDANDCLKVIDDELLHIRRTTYQAAIEKVELDEDLDNFTKEKGRHKEKARMREIEGIIRFSRLMLVRTYFQARVLELVFVLVTILAILEIALERNMIFSLFPLIYGGWFILMTISSRKQGDHFASIMIEAYMHYALCEAVVTLLDFRGQETIDLDQIPVAHRYTLGEILTPVTVTKKSRS